MYQNHKIMATTQLQLLTKLLAKLGCMRTSFADGYTSIERRTIFDLWQMSYVPRSSLRKNKNIYVTVSKVCSNNFSLEKENICSFKY